ncbi:MAG: ABC transporter ATP-binding protein [Bacteroidaceae bacterium]|nr:ABC transporter ATP-binding protein [Bacteroidaceae bacterium]
MIHLSSITKSFGTLQVLKGIDLDIMQGEIVSIVGPSGAGKTTLLQIMGTLDAPDSGAVCIDSVDTTTLSAKALARFRNRQIGFVFQFHQLLPEFTALENVMIPALIGGTGRREARQRAAELLDIMGLSERAQHKPAELSGGEKQRVAVARALVNNPSVILADEPSGSLDSANKAELHRLFFDLRERLGQTFVIVTHDEELARTTDRTIHLRDGLVVSPVTAPEVPVPEVPVPEGSPEVPVPEGSSSVKRPFGPSAPEGSPEGFPLPAPEGSPLPDLAPSVKDPLSPTSTPETFLA